MLDYFTYDFGYHWLVTYGHVIPLALFGALAAASLWRHWPVWVATLSGLIAVWSIVALVITHVAFRINTPYPPPTERFLRSGTGQVLDAGAGSGRAAIGLLLARPRATVTALDIYDGFFGIDDNTPDRLLANARIAGVADRVEARIGDMREMPFADGAFDGVISVAAIDHLRDEGITRALAEVARVLKPGGEFLLTIVDVDVWAWLASPHAMAHHRPVDAARWRSRLEQRGFEVIEQGKQPSALYYLAHKVS
jgi:SAM-dependent methyltransferase